MLNQHYNTEKISGSKNCLLPDKLPNRVLFSVWYSWHPASTLYIPIPCVLALLWHVLWMLVQRKKKQPPIANWSYLFYPFNSQAKVCTGLSLWGTLKIPLSIRRLQPCGRKCAVTGVRFPSVMNWGMVGDHSHTCHEHPWTKKFGRGCSQYRQRVRIKFGVQEVESQY